MIDFTPLAPANSIKFDLTPVRIYKDYDAPSYLKARLIITDAHYYIFEEGPQGFPVLSEAGPIFDFNRVGPGHISFTTEDKVSYQAEKNPGCNCGSTLKSFHPFFGVPYERF